MKKIIVNFTFFVFSLSLAASENTWFYIFEASDFTVYMKKDSLEIKRLENGDVSASAIIREQSKKEEKPIVFYKLEVLIADCEKGYGKLMMINLDGLRSQQFGFAFDGGNLVSSVAEGLCLSALGAVQVNNSQVEAAGAAAAAQAAAEAAAIESEEAINSKMKKD